MRTLTWSVGLLLGCAHHAAPAAAGNAACADPDCAEVADDTGEEPDDTVDAAPDFELDAAGHDGAETSLDTAETPDAADDVASDAPTASTAADEACEAALFAQWAASPPAVGLGPQAANTSYDAVFVPLMAKYGIPGGAVAVTRNGQLVFARGYGFADVASHQPAHPAQLFRIASLSKQMTATAILQLVEAGTLSLDAPAFSYLPNLQPLPGKTLNPQLATITIAQLLHHAGGWNRDAEAVGDPLFHSPAIAAALGEPGPASATDTIRYMLDKPLTYAPGTTYCYSNFGYVILGAILEQVTGSPYAGWLQQHVLAPQGIVDMAIGGSLQAQAAPDEVTYYDYPGDGLANSVFPGASGSVPWPYGGFNLGAMTGNGAWIASPVDMLRFARGVDKYAGLPTLLSASTLAQMLANPGIPSCNADGSTTAATDKSWYGFGFLVNKYGNYWHNGSLPGTMTEDVIANNGFAFAAFFNSRPANADAFATDLDNALWSAFGGVNADDWPADDAFDQYAPSSAWASQAAYAAQATAAAQAGQYPARVEGRLNGAQAEFRAQSVPLHPGATFQSGANLDCVAYQAAATQNAQSGLGLASVQTFVDAAGRTRLQATWQAP